MRPLYLSAVLSRSLVSLADTSFWSGEVETFSSESTFNTFQTLSGMDS
jgi:hypothetical protein